MTYNPLKTIHSTSGSCVDFDVVFTGEDITDDTFNVYSTTAPTLFSATVTIVDASGGTIHVSIDDAVTALLLGYNEIRIRRAFMNGCSAITPPIGLYLE